MSWPGLLRQAQGKDAAQLWRAAEIVDLGVLRQMWRPSALAGIPAALSRAQHAIASGEARHPAMKRIGAAEWDAARSLALQTIEALSPLAAATGRAPLPGLASRAPQRAFATCEPWAFARRKLCAGGS